MASSGSFNTSKYDGRYLKFSWSIKSQSTANNQTVISWSLKGAGTGSSSWYMSGPFKLIVNGETVYSSSTRIKLYDGTEVASGTSTIKHNTDGTKTFSASCSAAIYSTSNNVSGSGSWSLTAIPRYATVTQTLSSKTETTATIKWSSDSTIDYIWWSKDNGSSWTGINVADGTSGSYSISGLSANTTYKIKTRVRRKDSQLTTDSSALSVTTYNYPYCTSMPDFMIGDSMTLKFYNPLGRTITFSIIANGTELTATGWTLSGTSYTGFTASSTKEKLYATIPNATSATYKVKVTYGSQVSTKTGGTYIIDRSQCQPTIGEADYADTNATTLAITLNYHNIIQNQSIVRYAAGGLTAKNSASIKSCSVSVNGNTYNLTLSGTNASGGNAKINSGTNVTATFTVTDSRGITASVTRQVTMLAWSLPTANITLRRESNFYAETNITVRASYSSLNSKNTISISYKAKKSGTTSYTISGTLSNGVTSTFTADNNYAWDVVITVTDRFGTTTYNRTLSRGMPIIFFDRVKNAVGVNAFPASQDTLEVDGDVVLSKTSKGLRGVDKTGSNYPLVCDNGSNLWIGSYATASKHHVGATYISSGYNGSTGYSTIYVSVPNASNTDATNYAVYHAGYKPSPADIGAVPTSRTINGHNLSGNVTLTPSDLGIGTYDSGDTSVSISSGTEWVSTGASVTLAKGVYVLIGTALFASNATGRRLAVWRSRSGSSGSYTYTNIGVSNVNQMAVSGTTTRLQSVAIVAPSSNTTYVFHIQQNSGSELSTTVYWRYVKIA